MSAIFAIRPNTPPGIKKITVFDLLKFGGGDTPDIYNTISRELLNNAYNPRFCEYSEQAMKVIKNSLNKE